MLKSIHCCWYRVQNADIVLGPLFPVPALFALFLTLPSIFPCFLLSNSSLSPNTIPLSQTHTFLLLAVLLRLHKQLFLNETVVSIHDHSLLLVLVVLRK